MAAAEELWRRADSGTAKAIASPRALQSIAGLAMNLCHGFAVKRHRFVDSCSRRRWSVCFLFVYFLVKRMPGSNMYFLT